MAAASTSLRHFPVAPVAEPDQNCDLECEDDYDNDDDRCAVAVPGGVVVVVIIVKSIALSLENRRRHIVLQRMSSTACVALGFVVKSNTGICAD